MERFVVITLILLIVLALLCAAGYIHIDTSAVLNWLDQVRR